MAKALPVHSDGKVVGHVIMCPACGCGHLFDGRWAFNGDTEKPTFSPSMLVRGQRYPSGRQFPNDDEHKRMMAGEDFRPQMVPTWCHSFVTDGRIEYLADCTHALKGRTVDLPDV